LLIEAIFNPRGRQGGALRWILGPERQVETGGAFNANPVLAGYAIGNFVSEPAHSQQRRATLAAALSAIGDRLVWGLLRPLAVAASLLAATAGPIPAGIVLLLVYNPPELALRWRSIRRGLEGSAAVLQDLSGDGLPHLAGGLARLGACAVGCLGGYWLAGTLLSCALMESLGLVAGLVAAGVLARVLRPSIWGPPLVALLLALLWMVVEGIGANGQAP
jgi:hypothetical protein